MGHFLKGFLTGTVTTLAAIGSYRLISENEKQESKTYQRNIAALQATTRNLKIKQQTKKNLN